MPTLRDQITLFLQEAEILTLEAKQQDINLDEDAACDEAIETLCEKYSTWVYDTFSGTTPHNYITKFRNAIRTAQLHNAFLYFMRERDAEVVARQQAHHAKIIHRQENQYPITPEQAEALIETSTRLLESTYYADVVVGLCVLTGRRPYEVAVKGRFRCHRHPVLRANQYLYFRGLAKQQDAVRTRAVREQPVLIDPNVICAAHRRFFTLKHARDLWRFHPRHSATDETSADRAFMNYCGGRFREQCTKYLRPIVPDMVQYLDHHVTPQSLRKYYECLVDAWWDHTGWAAPRFIMEILGHYDLRHGNSYLDICLTERVAWRFLAHNRIERNDDATPTTD